MLIFIQNVPRTYAWGSRDALPEVLATEPTGEPQAELWLGDHEVDPAQVAGSMAEPLTLIDLIERNPEVYGVDGGHLPFLLKVLGIGAPLSLQVHPRKSQAEEGFARENAAGIALDDLSRSYKDANHKPELLVALSHIEALSGWRELGDAANDAAAIARGSGTCGARGSQLLLSFAARVQSAARLGVDGKAGREALLDWLLPGDEIVVETVRALAEVVMSEVPLDLDGVRRDVLRKLVTTHPGDPGVLISLLMHVVTLNAGEALYLDAGVLHAYLGGVGVEIMASSDNVLRAGLTEKHIDVPEFRRILDLTTTNDPLFYGATPAPGLTTWQPPIPDFQLHRVRVDAEHDPLDAPGMHLARAVSLEAPYPLVMIATEGVLRVERIGVDLREVASVRKGHSLYISAGAAIEISGSGEAFVASVGCRSEIDISRVEGVS
ncbi:mannose-6-phosphate isomerase, class I [Leucobacter chinensis]|uniref:mannose-6-phosphate isomerase, class I n=1 Tax=Leucobacter chinensis TaxID=2851010 RepID=UPI001C237224